MTNALGASALIFEKRGRVRKAFALNLIRPLLLDNPSEFSKWEF